MRVRLLHTPAGLDDGFVYLDFQFPPHFLVTYGIIPLPHFHTFGVAFFLAVTALLDPPVSEPLVMFAALVLDPTFGHATLETSTAYR